MIARGNRRQVIFYDTADYEKYLARLRLYQTRYGICLYAFALMPNHVHLLVEVNHTPLSKMMHGLQFSYTQYFNSRHRKIGHLFHARYRAILCQRESYLLELIRYIHLNPLRAELVRSFEQLTTYPWTSLPDYLRVEGSRGVAVQEILPLFGKRKGPARTAFFEFMQTAQDMGHQGRLYDVKDQRILGDEEFAEPILQEQEADNDWAYDVPLATIEREACAQYGTVPNVLRSGGRNRRLVFIRTVIAYLNRGMRGGTIQEVAKVYNRTPAALTLTLRALEEKLQTDARLREEIGAMRERCVQGRHPKL
ncbi:MAG: transposase [Deltaproteobacteria bacterium]|nr:transposase [Deltaproteobacteria bacterium]